MAVVSMIGPGTTPAWSMVGAPTAGDVPRQAPDPNPPPTGDTTTTAPVTTTTAPPGSTTTLAPTTTTTQPGDTVPNPTTTQPSTAKPGTAPSGDPVGGGDAGSGDAEVTNPTAASRRAAPSGRTPKSVGGTSGAVIIRESAAARRNLDLRQTAYDEAVGRVAALEQRTAEIDQRTIELTADQAKAVRDYVAAKRELSHNAADAYMQVTSGPGSAEYFITATSPNELGTLRLYGESVLDAGKRAADEIETLRERLGDELVGLGNEKISVATELGTARDTVNVRLLEVETAKTAMLVFDLGSEIFISGYVFPVDDPNDFIDSYGAPRMFGTGYAHFHEGTDIMAPFGTALFACETGTIIRVRENVLGGITLKVLGDSGTEYYYAHLSAYADGITEGMPVTAGTVIGFVGNTGNARYTAPHLHYEIHPGGGPSVNPYALLRVADGLETTATVPP
jgi:murein DD-endopeptidase MepM/ murein hydrolase activator NlpD